MNRAPASDAASPLHGEAAPVAVGREEPAPVPPHDEPPLEPHEGLRYIARLFKLLALLILLLLVAETVIGIMQQGTGALPVLLVEATRLVVFAGFLWAGGDLAILLIESNHDLRATRLMVARLARRLEAPGAPRRETEPEPPLDVPPG